MKTEKAAGALVLLGALVLTACTAAAQPSNTAAENQTDADTLAAAEAVAAPANGAATQLTEPVAPADLPEIAPPSNPEINPRVEVPSNLRVNWLIPPDGIRPIYGPEFAPADEAPLQDDELIIGVAWGGEAKAYSISVLRSREMVNDELAGIPTLVTW